MERNTKHQTPSSREVPESKHQKPNSKHQRNPKFQAPNRGPRFELGTWSLKLFWCLELGVWGFPWLWHFSRGVDAKLQTLTQQRLMRTPQPPMRGQKRVWTRIK